MLTRRHVLKLFGLAPVALSLPLPETPATFVMNKAPKLRGIYISAEALRDIQAWGVDEIDEATRKEIYSAN